MYTYCMNCGARNDRTATSCVNCGVALQPTETPSDSTATEGSGTAPTPPSPPASSGETYSPPDTSQSGAERSGDYGSSTQPQDPSSQPTAGAQGSQQQPDGGFESSTPPPDTPYGSEGGSSRSDERREEYAPSSGAYGSSGSTGGASYTGPASGGGVGTQVPNRLVPAIVLTVVSFILAFFTFGITGIGVITGAIAIVFAAMVNGRASSGDIQGAQQASRVARILNLVTIGILVIGVIIGVILIVIFVLALSAQGGGA
jgi:hypothetical protein